MRSERRRTVCGYLTPCQMHDQKVLTLSYNDQLTALR